MASYKLRGTVYTSRYISEIGETCYFVNGVLQDSADCFNDVIGSGECMEYDAIDGTLTITSYDGCILAMSVPCTDIAYYHLHHCDCGVTNITRWTDRPAGRTCSGCAKEI